MTITVDIYSTRKLMGVIEQLKPAHTWVRDNFFTETDYADSEYIDIDIEKGKRKLAPFVNPLHEGKVMTREGYTTSTFKAPYIKVKRPTTAVDTLNRMAGMGMYDAESPAQRAARLLTKDLRDLNDYINRREEWMCVQQLTGGSFTVSGEGFSATISLGVESTHALANTSLTDNGWATAASCAPLTDLDALQLVISQDSGFVAEDVIMGSTAFTKFMASTQVQDEWLPAGGQQIGTSFMRGNSVMGAIFQGVARNKRIWTYNEYYLDDTTGVEGPMVPVKKIVMVARGAKAIRHYGCIQDMDAPGGARVRVFPKSWKEPDPSAQWLMLQSAPLPLFHQVDAFAYAQVIA